MLRNFFENKNIHRVMKYHFLYENVFNEALSTQIGRFFRKRAGPRKRNGMNFDKCAPSIISNKFCYFSIFNF